MHGEMETLSLDIELWRAFMAPDHNCMDLWAQVLRNLSLLRSISTDVELEAVFSTGMQLCSC